MPIESVWGWGEGRWAAAVTGFLWTRKKKKTLLQLAPLRDVGMGGGEGLTGATQRWGRD